MWIAREKNGLLRIYTKQPIRKEESGVWYLPDDGDCMTIDSAYYPYLKWEDKPMEVELTAMPLFERFIDDVIHKYIAYQDSGKFATTNHIVNQIIKDIEGK